MSRKSPGKRPERSVNTNTVIVEPRVTVRSRPWFKVTISAVLILLAVLAGVVLSFHWMYEPDLGWHLAQGREIASGHFVKTNLFSWTEPNYPQPFQSWLFEFAAFGLSNLGGAAALQIGQAVVIALTLILVYLACRYRSSVPVALAITILGVFLLEPRAVPRPHIVSFVLGAACALLLDRAKQTRSVRPLVWAIPLVALWSNVHAECLFGAALIGLFAVGEFLRPQALSRRQAWFALGIAAACTAANLLNPFGTGLFVYLWENARTPDFVQIAEFRPPYLPTYAPFFAYLAIGAALLAWKRRTLALWEFLVFGAFAILALRHLRFVSLFLCVTAPIVAACLAKAAGRLANTPALPAVAICLGLLLTPVPLSARFQFFGVGTEYIQPPTLASSGAASFIRTAGLKGPMFNSVNLGGYLIWNLYPDVRVFQDTRFRTYSPDHFRRIVKAFQSQAEWDKLVAGVDWAVLTLERNTPLTGYGKFPVDEWAPVYQDSTMAVVVRRAGKYGALAAGR